MNVYGGGRRPSRCAAVARLDLELASPVRAVGGVDELLRPRRGRRDQHVVAGDLDAADGDPLARRTRRRRAPSTGHAQRPDLARDVAHGQAAVDDLAAVDRVVGDLGRARRRCCGSRTARPRCRRSRRCRPSSWRGRRRRGCCRRRCRTARCPGASARAVIAASAASLESVIEPAGVARSDRTALARRSRCLSERSLTCLDATVSRLIFAPLISRSACAGPPSATNSASRATIIDAEERRAPGGTSAFTTNDRHDLGDSGCHSANGRVTR